MRSVGLAGLAHLDEAEPPTNLRMADAAHFILACEPATEFEPGSTIRAIAGIQHEMMTDRIVNDPLFIELAKILANVDSHKFEGTVGELHEKLQYSASQVNNRLWKTPSRLSNHIARKTEMLRDPGLNIDLGEKVKTGRIVRITADLELIDSFKNEDFWPPKY